jgi:dolichol-phosphate mannosyltransferase
MPIDSLRQEQPRLVIVTPVHNEADTLNRYVEEVSRLLIARTDVKTRVLFVDDGSSDGSWQIIENLAAKSDAFIGVRLSRNFGAHIALAAGFDHVPSDSDIVATLACDLQDPPATIIEFIQEWRKGADIVWGKRRTRAEKGLRLKASQLLERLVRRYAMPPKSQFQTGSFLLIDRKVLDALRLFREHSRVTFALVAWTGYDQAIVLYDRQPRLGGRSGWTFGQMISTAYDVLIGFSAMPARALTVFGLVMLMGSIVTVAYLVVTWLVSDVQPGWTGLMTTMTLCFGILFVMMGVSFEYLYRILIETKARPLYFVTQHVGNSGARPAA